MNRKFAASFWIWSAALGEDAEGDMSLIEKISDLGFDGVEIPTFDARMNPEQVSALLDSAKGRNGRLVPIVIGGGSPETDLSSVSEQTRARGQEYVRRLVDFCAGIGGNLVCGPLYAAVGAKKMLLPEERTKILDSEAGQFKLLAKYARDRSVQIALEPLCRYDTNLINTAAQGRELVDKIDEENIGLLLDTFHMNIEEKSIGGAIRTAGSKLLHFHACENDRGTPGTGHMNWGEVRTALDDLKYRGWVSIESFVPEMGGFSSAMNVWRHLAPTQDEIAVAGLAFLNKTLNG